MAECNIHIFRNCHFLIKKKKSVIKQNYNGNSFRAHTSTPGLTVPLLSSPIDTSHVTILIHALFQEELTNLLEKCHNSWIHPFIWVCSKS